MTEKKKKQYKSDVIAEQFLEHIKSGRWKVGDKLPSESKLVEEFNVSRVCLRESLKKLEVIGAVEILQGDGTYVTEVNPARFVEPLFSMLSIDKNSINDIYEVRIYLESGAYKKTALQRTDEDVKKLADMVRKMEEAARCMDYTEFSRYDRKFHDTIMRLSGSRLVLTFYDMFRNIMKQYTYQLNTNVEVVERSMGEHQQILLAIKEKNGELAGQMIAVHLERSKRVLLKMGII